MQFKYDTRGNVRYDELSAVHLSEYDRRNLPLKMAVEIAGEDTVFYKYSYNDGGNRILRENKDSMERYLYDATGRAVAVYDINTNNMKYAYLYGNDMIGKIDFTSTPERFYNVKDHLGSTRLVYDETGTVVDRMDYFPYGEFLGSRNITGIAKDATKFHFTGKENDFETGYHYFGARYYNKYLGLWNSVDPLAGKYPGWSPYNYTFGNPLKFIDLDGKEGDEDFISKMKQTLDDLQNWVQTRFFSSNDASVSDNENSENSVSNEISPSKTNARLAKEVKKKVRGVKQNVEDELSKFTPENVGDASSNLAVGAYILGGCVPFPVAKGLLYGSGTVYSSIALGTDWYIASRDMSDNSFLKAGMNTVLFGGGQYFQKSLTGMESLGKSAPHVADAFTAFWETSVWSLNLGF